MVHVNVTWSMLHCAPAHHFLTPISSVQKALFSPAFRLSQLLLVANRVGPYRCSSHDGPRLSLLLCWTFRSLCMQLSHRWQPEVVPCDSPNKKQKREGSSTQRVDFARALDIMCTPVDCGYKLPTCSVAEGVTDLVGLTHT